jgi:hypothetical protein
MAAPVRVPAVGSLRRAVRSAPACQRAVSVTGNPASGFSCEDFVETTLWGTEHLSFLRRFYCYDSGIPSHDTLCDVFAALDPELFQSCFLAWINGLRDDGPTSSRSTARPRGAATTGGRADTAHLIVIELPLTEAIDHVAQMEEEAWPFFGIRIIEVADHHVADKVLIFRRQRVACVACVE